MGHARGFDAARIVANVIDVAQWARRDRTRTHFRPKQPCFTSEKQRTFRFSVEEIGESDYLYL